MYYLTSPEVIRQAVLRLLHSGALREGTRLPSPSSGIYQLVCPLMATRWL